MKIHEDLFRPSLKKEIWDFSFILGNLMMAKIKRNRKTNVRKPMKIAEDRNS
jgi:hypothetical protein